MSSNKLKYPVLNNVDYFEVLKNRSVVLEIPGDQLEGLEWRDLQKKIGESIPTGEYNYSFKFKNSGSIERGKIRAIGTVKAKETPDMDPVILKKIDEALSKINSSQHSSDQLMSMQSKIYETQIDLIKGNLKEKEDYIKELKKTIESLEEDLDHADDKISELESKTGLAQYLEIGKEFLKMKSGRATPLKDFSMSNSSDIPQEILTSLGVVAWDQIDSNLLNEIVNYLNIFIIKLPMKASPDV